jgi:glycosyltransferase involved in cell wall biosynthesis
VVVCTRNRSERLREALASLRAMRTPAELAWELVVIDNNSSDGTPALVSDFGRESPFPVRYAFEQRGGIAVARNRGAAEAQGDVIAYTDDDCIVDPDWGSRIAAAFASDPALVMLGGRVELHDPADAPLAIRTSREARELGNDVSNYGALIGANFAFRRGILERTGGFDPRFGAGSGHIRCAEDAELLYRILKLGGRVAYMPDILVYHHHGRRSDEVDRRRFEYAHGRGGILAKNALRGDPAAIRMARWELGKLLQVVCAPNRAARERAEAWITLRALAQGAAAYVSGLVRTPFARS